MIEVLQNLEPRWEDAGKLARSAYRKRPKYQINHLVSLLPSQDLVKNKRTLKDEGKTFIIDPGSKIKEQFIANPESIMDIKITLDTPVSTRKNSPAKQVFDQQAKRILVRDTAEHTQLLAGAL